VAAVLAAHANKDGLAYPGLTLMASLSGIDKRGLHREITALERAEFIRIEHRFHPSGEPASNYYWLIFDEQVSSKETTPPAASEQVSPPEATDVAPRNDTVPPPERIPVASADDRRESRTVILTAKGTEGAAPSDFPETKNGERGRFAPSEAPTEAPSPFGRDPVVNDGPTRKNRTKNSPTSPSRGARVILLSLIFGEPTHLGRLTRTRENRHSDVSRRR
jgi:hypothetical protein